MANCIIAFPNRIDESTLTGGSYTSTLPRSNLLTSILSEVARTTDATAASSLVNIALTKARTIKLISILNHNLLPGTSPTYRIRGYSDAGMTIVLYDSGILPVYTRMFSTLTLNFEDANWWDGVPLTEDIAGYTWNITHVLTTATTAQYWKIELIDTTNAAGYIQFGRVFIAGAWQPVANMSYGASIGYETNTKISRARGGAKYFDVRTPYRVARFNLDFMTVDEGYAIAFDSNRILGLDKEVFYMYDAADTIHQLRRSFIGTLRKLSPIEQPYSTLTKTSYEIEESL